MKRIAVLLLALALLCSGALAGFEDGGLSFEIGEMAILDEWEGESSDTNKWILIEGKLTNWEVEPLEIAKNLSATLIFRNKYVFEAVPVFDRESIEPLLELDGGLLFVVPNMVAEADAEMMRIALNVWGKEAEIALDENVTSIGARRSGNSFECEGFKTAEDAVAAYVDAFNRGDVPGMLSTFAIETYVDNVDAQAYLERLKTAAMTIPQGIPIANDYMREVQILKRYGEFGDYLYRQYLVYNTPEDYADLTEGKPVRLMEEGDAAAFMEAMREVPMTNWFGKIKLKQFLNPEDFSDAYMNEVNQKNIQRMADGYGCDALLDVPALLEIDGEEYLLLLQCARYGEKWYNVSMTGNVANLMGLNTFCGGLALLEDVVG